MRSRAYSQASTGEEHLGGPGYDPGRMEQEPRSSELVGTSPRREMKPTTREDGARLSRVPAAVSIIGGVRVLVGFGAAVEILDFAAGTAFAVSDPLVVALPGAFEREDCAWRRRGRPSQAPARSS